MVFFFFQFNDVFYANFCISTALDANMQHWLLQQNDDNIEVSDLTMAVKELTT